jgi:hypothetical protein
MRTTILSLSMLILPAARTDPSNEMDIAERDTLGSTVESGATHSRLSWPLRDHTPLMYCNTRKEVEDAIAKTGKPSGEAKENELDGSTVMVE